MPDTKVRPRRPMRVVLALLGVALGSLFGVAVLALVLWPEMLLFHPTREIVSTPRDVGLAFERVEVDTADGERLMAWYVPGRSIAGGGRPAEGAPTLVIYCHGNGGNIGDRVGLLPALTALGPDVLIFDYRGYGESSGRPSVEGTRHDIEAVWAYATKARGHPPQRIVLWGRSLGGAVAIDQAARASAAGQPPAALIAESTFTSTIAIGEEVYPWLPVRWLAADLDYPSRDLIGKVDAPILVAHSRDDDLIPWAHGQQLVDAARAGIARTTEFVELRGGHNEAQLSGEEHRERLSRFLGLP